MENSITTRSKSNLADATNQGDRSYVSEFSEFRPMKNEFAVMKAELTEFKMAKHMRQMVQITQLVKSLRNQNSAEVGELRIGSMRLKSKKTRNHYHHNISRSIIITQGVQAPFNSACEPQA